MARRCALRAGRRLRALLGSAWRCTRACTRAPRSPGGSWPDVLDEECAHQPAHGAGGPAAPPGRRARRDHARCRRAGAERLDRRPRVRRAPRRRAAPGRRAGARARRGPRRPGRGMGLRRGATSAAPTPCARRCAGWPRRPRPPATCARPSRGPASSSPPTRSPRTPTATSSVASPPPATGPRRCRRYLQLRRAPGARAADRPVSADPRARGADPDTASRQATVPPPPSAAGVAAAAGRSSGRTEQLAALREAFDRAGEAGSCCWPVSRASARRAWPPSWRARCTVRRTVLYGRAQEEPLSSLPAVRRR